MVKIYILLLNIYMVQWDINIKLIIYIRVYDNLGYDLSKNKSLIISA